MEKVGSGIRDKHPGSATQVVEGLDDGDGALVDGEGPEDIPATPAGLVFSRLALSLAWVLWAELRPLFLFKGSLFTGGSPGMDIVWAG
jgi:hypothetical protein